MTGKLHDIEKAFCLKSQKWAIKPIPKLGTAEIIYELEISIYKKFIIAIPHNDRHTLKTHL
jgi:hypothetical protein